MTTKLATNLDAVHAYVDWGTHEHICANNSSVLAHVCISLLWMLYVCIYVFMYSTEDMLGICTFTGTG